MKKLLLLLQMTIIIIVANDTIEAITPFVKSWHPTMTLDNKVLTVQTKENRVSEDMYQAVLNGVCTSLWTGDKKWKGIKEIQILNKFSKQGYIFEGGEKECVELGNVKDSKIYILTKTHQK